MDFDLDIDQEESRIKVRGFAAIQIFALVSEEAKKAI